MQKRTFLIGILGLLAFCLLAVAVYHTPFIHERLAWRVENLQTQARHALNPPEQVIFVPQQNDQATMESIVQATVQAALATPALTQTLLAPAQAQATLTPQPTLTSTPTLAPLPDEVALTGYRHEWQQMNNCGPATLAMGLSFWGWEGDQTDTRAVLRPNYRQVDDKNVNPEEMVAYVQAQNGLSALTRIGGNIELLKRLLAAGYPVLIEKGLQHSPKDWMGHYVLVTGYNEERQRFITQDSYTGPGENVMVPYAELSERWWRDFNYVYVVIFPREQEEEVLALLGLNADEQENARLAAAKAEQEITRLSGRDLYFAWYNLGSSRVRLEDYVGAATAYDQAFAIYPSIPEDDRPWRMLWYQFGPYQAYYQTGRYQDVLSLANQTLFTLGKPILEESLYWQGRAQEALGQVDQAVSSYRQAAAVNPDSTPALAELQRLGVSP
jgi:tetratricopeptide (TPR) repeat protein